MFCVPHKNTSAWPKVGVYITQNCFTFLQTHSFLSTHQQVQSCHESLTSAKTFHLRRHLPDLHTVLTQRTTVQQDLRDAIINPSQLNDLLGEKVNSLCLVEMEHARIFSLENLPSLITVCEELIEVDGAGIYIYALILIHLMDLSDGLRTGKWCPTVESVQKLVACRELMVGTTPQVAMPRLDEVIRGALAWLHSDTIELNMVPFSSMRGYCFNFADVCVVQLLRSDKGKASKAITLGYLAVVITLVCFLCYVIWIRYRKVVYALIHYGLVWRALSFLSNPFT